MASVSYVLLRCLALLNAGIIVQFLLLIMEKWTNLESPVTIQYIVKEEVIEKIARPQNWYTSSYFLQRGDFYVGYNHIPAELQFFGNESITLTVPADHTNLDNLEQLVSRWQGPISCALFAPGTDYDDAVKAILYLRECSPTTLIKDYVTFHLIFPRGHIPPDVFQNDVQGMMENITDFSCDVQAAPTFGGKVPTYRKINGLFYPINVARNVARSMAQTHFVFPSDIELYPSPGFIPSFFQMLNAPENEGMHQKPKQVWVFPVFEVDQKVKKLPLDKPELKGLLDKKKAVPFHKFVCSYCHNIPEIYRWAEEFEPEKVMGSFMMVKRMGNQASWEPFYVGTKLEPEFDERVTWEGKNNKRVQAFTMCLLNYDFHIMDKAFLVHRPGIKRKRTMNVTLWNDMNKLLKSTIVPELTRLYRNRIGCRI